MPVKFKVGFTIPAETLFGMIAKFLPIEDLHVEEIVDRPQIKQSIATQSIVERAIAEISNQRKGYTHFKHESGKTLKQFVYEFLEKQSSKEATWTQLAEHALSLGFHKSSINNAISRLLEDKSIKRIGSGKYRIAEVKIAKSA